MRKIAPVCLRRADCHLAAKQLPRHDCYSAPANILFESPPQAIHGLLSGAARSGRLKIDASQVRTADTAGVQLLLTVQKRLAGEGGAIEWVGISTVLK